MPHNKDDPFTAIEDAAHRQQVSEQAVRAIASARARLILGRDAKSAFFATLALRLTPKVNWQCETMATDGRVLAYHPEFVLGLSPDELLGVLVHEVMHNALAHPFRRGFRDAVDWNIACDLAVNPLLVNAGFALPASRLMPGERDYQQLPSEKSAEEYYALIAKPQPSEGPPSPRSTDPGGCGEVTTPTSRSPSETEDQVAEWQVALTQAEQAASGRGALPAGLGRAVKEVLRPRQDWRAVLREFVSSHARNDYSWTRLNRRFLWQGLYLPGLHSEELGEIVIAIDTSGSIQARHLGQFTDEVNGVLEAFECTATVLYHDTEVQHVQTWRSSDGPLVLTPIGGGGTSHVGVFEWAKDHHLSLSCLICLTDLDTVFPDFVPDVPVLWAAIGNPTTLPPFGRVVLLGD